MNASIQDNQAMLVLGATEFSAYLRSTGWDEVKLRGDRAAIWQKRNEAGKEFEVLIPQKRSLDDYALRMAQALEVLSIIEARSQLAIYADILRTLDDTVRIHFHSSDFDDGSVPLEQAVNMIEGAREMMLAAACAAVQPRAAYSKRKPKQATEHLERVRMGQTERGSFVLSLQTRVPPRLQSVEHRQAEMDLGLPPIEREEPFERRVTMTLAQSLNAAMHAALRANAKSDLSPFKEVISQGVNANLCDAIAALGLETQTKSLAIGFQWSPSRALLAPAPRSVEFSTAQFGILREVARLFREIEPVEDFDLVGHIVVFKRETGEREGQITVSGYVEERLRRVRIVLDDADYQRANQAHMQEQPILCTGELVREGNSFTLRNPRNFTILSE